MAYFELSSKERGTFLVLARHTVLEGPLKLVRFSSTESFQKEIDSRLGDYWMYACQVKEILLGTSGAGPASDDFLPRIHNTWAVKHKWSDLSRIWVMNIPPGGTLNAYFGFARRQVTTDDVFLDGGALQIVTRVKAMERHWVTGPFMTVGFAASEL